MFKKAFDHILRVEGDRFVHDPVPTRFGITQGTFSRWLRHSGLPDTSVEEIQREEVYAIYHDNYWHEGRCHMLPWPLACYHFDGYVNLLPRDAGRVLQRALNVSGVEITIDGIVGPETIRKAKRVHNSQVLTEYLWERARLYLRKVKANEKKLEFLPTWMWRLDKLREV